MTSLPPLLGRVLLRLRPLGARRRDVEADLLELFEQRVASLGRRRASWRYLRDATSLWLHRLPDPDAITTPPRRSRGHMRQDIVFALRLFRRQPGFFGTAVVGLAIAMALSTAIFGVVDSAVLRGNGLDPAIVRVTLTVPPWSRTSGASISPFFGDWTYRDFTALQVDDAVSLAASSRTFVTLRTTSGVAVSMVGRAVTGRYFQTLGASTALGRTFGPADDDPAAKPAVVISYAFWNNVLKADPAVIGSTVWLDDVAYTVVGVTARGLLGDSGRYETPAAFWVTLGNQAANLASRQMADAGARRAQLEALRQKPVPAPNDLATMQALQREIDRAAPDYNPSVMVIARLPSETAKEQLASTLNGQAIALAAASGQRIGPTVLQVVSANSREDTAAVSIMAILVGLIAVLAAANVTNVLLASAAGRAREIGTRLALGAGRSRIARQLITESLVIGAAGGALGLLASFWTSPILASLMQLPPTFDVSVNLRAGLFVAGVTTFMGVAAGLAPVRYVRAGDLASTLKTEQIRTSLTTRPGRLRSLLIGCQAAASILLLALAALCARSAIHASTMPLGFDADHLASVAVSLPASYDDSRTDVYWRTAIERALATPGITAAALVNPAPFEGAVGSRIDNHYVHRIQTSADYFAAAGTRIVRGRAYTDAEARSNASVAVISESLARLYWGGKSPLGARMTKVWDSDDRPGASLGNLVRRPAGTIVVGVAADAVLTLDNHEALTIYLPMPAGRIGGARLLARTAGNPRATIGALTASLKTLDADPGITLRTAFVDDNVSKGLEKPRTLRLLTTILSAAALVLAVIGLFGVTAFVVRQRQHEIGVRLSLGATGSQIVQMLVREGMRPIYVGLAVGLGLALLGGRVVQAILYGVTGHDPLALVAAVGVLLAAAGAAILIPARRALRVDPARSLRES